MNTSITLSLTLLPPPRQDILMDYTFEEEINTNRSTTIISKYDPVYHFVIRCISLYALILVIIGTIGNILTIIILCRPNLRRYVTMRYLIALSVSDIISLYGWNLNNFYKFTISTKENDNLEELSLAHCRIISYLSFVGLQLSSWCLTTVSLDRCLSLYFLTWKQKYGKLSRAKYHIAILTIICLLLNSHILFLNGYRNNETKTIVCYATPKNPYYIFPRWERIHTIVYNICPFIIMLLCNSFIILITIRSARIRTQGKSLHSNIARVGTSGKNLRSNITRHRQLSIMLMLVTFTFVLLTLPSCLYFVFFRHRMSSTTTSKMYRYMVQICLSSVQFTSHAINFFLYCFSATNFRNELQDFIKEICFCRTNEIPSRPTTTTTFSRNSRNQKKSKSDLALEYQDSLKNISKTLLKQNENCDNQSSNSN